LQGQSECDCSYCVDDVPVPGGVGSVEIDGCVVVMVPDVVDVVDVVSGVVDVVPSGGAVSWTAAFAWSGEAGGVGTDGSLIGVPNGITVPVLRPALPGSTVGLLDWPGRVGICRAAGSLVGVLGEVMVLGVLGTLEVAWLPLPDRDELCMALAAPPPLTSWNAPEAP
jgi:hypothetical protein